MNLKFRMPLLALLVLAQLGTINAHSSTETFEADQSPCPTGRCREVCTYEGSGNGKAKGVGAKGKLTIKTIFENASGAPTFRVLFYADLDATLAGVKVYLDETARFDERTLRLRSIDRLFTKTLSYLGTKNISRPKFNKVRFYWPDLDGAPVSRSEEVRIEARNLDSFRPEWKPFATKYLKPDQFGAEWFADFDAAKPDAKPDETKKNLPNELLSGLFVPLYHLRYAPLKDRMDYELFVDARNRPENNHGQSIRIDTLGATFFSQPVEGTPNYRITGKVDIDKFVTPPDQPAEMFIDPTTHRLLEVNLHLMMDDGSAVIHANGKLKNCQVTEL